MTRTVTRSLGRDGGKLEVVVCGVAVSGIVVDVVDELEVVVLAVIVGATVVVVGAVGVALGTTRADASDTAPVATSFTALRRKM